MPLCVHLGNGEVERGFVLVRTRLELVTGTGRDLVDLDAAMIATLRRIPLVL
jgi:hypothetical protein